MAEREKRYIRLIKAPWLSLHRRLGRKAGGLRLSRRQRQWGLVLLGVLVVLIGMFFYLTNPTNLRISAERYLKRLVNGQVTVGRASFSFTQGIKLSDIRILTKQGQAPGNLVFKADKLTLKLSWLALAQGRLAATAISAFRPEVFLVEHSSGHWNFEPLFVDRDFKLVRPLPRIILSEGEIHYYEDVAGKPILGGTFRLSAHFEPRGAQGNDYFGRVQISLAEQTLAKLAGRFDTASGTFSEIAAQISLTEAARQSLPRQVRAWMDKYNLTGELSVSGDYGPLIPNRITAKLNGVSFRVPLNEQRSLVISNVRGQLQFTDSAILLGDLQPSESGKKEPLRFGALGAQWEIAGQFLGYHSQADFNLDISSPQLSLPRDPELIKSMPKVLRMILEDWDASGLVALEANIKRTAGVSPDIQASGQVRCIDVAGTFRHFPYPVTNIQGLIRFDPEKTFLEDFRAKHQSKDDPKKFAQLSGSGKVLAPYEDAQADINLSITGLVLDDELRLALRDEDKAKWDMFSPSGTADLSCRLVHRPGDGQKWTAYIETQLTGVSATAKEFPYPLADLRGRVYIGPDTVEIGRGVSEGLRPSVQWPNQGEFISGRAGKGSVQLRGLIDNLGGPDELMNLEVKAQRLEFDEVLVKALPPEARKLYEILNPSGSADISGKIIRSKAKSEELDFLIDVWPRDARCRHKDFPYPLEQVKGHVRLSPGKFELLDFSAHQGQASFTGGGVVATKDNEYYQAQLTITGQDLPLDKLVYQGLTPEHQQIWDQLQPAGICDITLKIINDQAGRLTYELTAELREGRITYKSLPYPLENLWGKVIIEPDLVTVDIWGNDPAIKIAGHIKQHKEQRSMNLAVFIQDIDLDEKLKVILPENVRRLWEAFEPQGRVDVKIDSLSLVPADSEAQRLALNGSLVLKNLSLNKPLLCRDLSGTITGTMQPGDQGLQLVLQGDLAVPELQLGPFQLQELSGVLTKASKDSDQWSIDNIRADLAGGQVFGHIKGNKGAPGKYSALLQIENVDLAELMRQFKSDKPNSSNKKKNGTPIQGRLKASVSLEGNFNDPGSAAGSGQVRIDQAQLYKLPLMMRIMNTLSLQPANVNAFDTVDVDFYLQGDKIIFTEIIMTGPALKMGGMGVYDRKKDLLAVVVKQDPPDNIWSNLPSLPAAIVAEINGPLADAKVVSKPFRDVSEELKRLFRKKKPRE